MSEVRQCGKCYNVTPCPKHGWRYELPSMSDKPRITIKGVEKGDHIYVEGAGHKGSIRVAEESDVTPESVEVPLQAVDPVLEQWEAARDGPPFEFGHHEKLVDAGDALAEAYRNEKKLHEIAKSFHDVAIADRNLADHKLAKAEAENQRLRAALEWYAKEERYGYSTYYDGLVYEGSEKADGVLHDEGLRAREALAEIEKEAGRG